MTTTEVRPEILPIDSKGRVRVSPARREEVLDEFERSGMTGAQFARTIGLKYQTFAFWRQQRQKRKPGASVPPQRTATVEWLETVIDKAQSSSAVSASALMVRLPSGAVLELANVSQVSVAAALLRAWEKAPC